MKIIKKQHDEVIQSLLDRLHSAEELNRVAAKAHQEEAEGHEVGTLGHYTAMDDRNRAYDRSHKFQIAMEVITQVTGIRHEF